MVEQAYIKNKLADTKCYRCGASLKDSAFALLNDKMPLITIGHVVCSSCQSQSMVTLTMAGNATTPMITDLVSEEVVKFTKLKEISYTELLDLHQALKKESLCRLMQKPEVNLENTISL
ncbi:hypothetical protein COT50_00645 [candidate division WWE3 bacterium CG08_land_8_20_14_0_20_41_10]|uniref:Uncharacterized protein n=1 Tax=candidate division WWE3 bacterium CG08_land_8_20_14_0_20_41_10 TaxID=1975085 RepID=A0A2H0XD01_UNCKA|nr:MAG: hypothetical protein COT50_00645 [candidate division WWE3 bacterium CG08_land_8_20_14_0_20_41_10]